MKADPQEEQVGGGMQELTLVSFAPNGKMGLVRYSSPNRKCVSETRVGYRVGQGFHFRLFRNSAGEAYSSRYTYFSNLVARTAYSVPEW